MKVDEPPDAALRPPMMARAARVLCDTEMPPGLATQMLLMIGEGHLVFKEPDIFALTTTGLLLGPSEQMPQA